MRRGALVTAWILSIAWSCQEPPSPSAAPVDDQVEQAKVAVVAERPQGDSTTGQDVESLPEIEDIEAWLTEFHRNPDPQRVPMAIVQCSTDGMFEKAGHVATAFFAEVFRLYPDRVEDWVESTRDLPEDHRHWLCISVWWSQCTNWEGILESFRPDAGEAFEASLDEYLARTPQPILESELSPSTLDGLWVSYFASGNPAYVEKITTALTLDHGEEDGLESLMIYGAARWSLASNARQHEEVKAVLEGVQTGSTGVLRSELSEILSEVP